MAVGRKRRRTGRRVPGKQGQGKTRRSEKVVNVETVVVTPKLFRIVHWGTFIAFFLAALTGLFHYYRITIIPEALGGVTTLGLCHFYTGVAFFGGMVLVFLIWGLRSIAFGPTEFAWLFQLGGFGKKYAKPPAAHRYNGGQKLFTLLICLVSLVLFATGVVFKFWHIVIPSNHDMVNTVAMLHVFMVTILLAMVAWHVYFSSIATPGRFDAMWGGKVRKDFMELHHSLYDLTRIKSKEEGARRRASQELERRKSKIRSAKVQTVDDENMPEAGEFVQDDDAVINAEVGFEAVPAGDAGGFDIDEAEFEDAEFEDVEAEDEEIEDAEIEEAEIEEEKE